MQMTGMKITVLFSELADDFDEAVEVVEVLIYRRETHIRHKVDVLQRREDVVAELGGGDFGAHFVRKLVLDAVDNPADGFGTDDPLFRRRHYSRDKL